MPVWPDMVDAFALFVDAQWTWVSVALGGVLRVGIDRMQLEASARLLRIELTPEVYSDIRVMEGAALTYWSSRRG